MTHERELYERQRALTDRTLIAGAKEADALAAGAIAWGIVITIEEIPVMPPAMGRTVAVPAVRISRERQRELEALRKAAEKSEEV